MSAKKVRVADIFAAHPGATLPRERTRARAEQSEASSGVLGARAPGEDFTTHPQASEREPALSEARRVGSARG